MLFAHAHLKTDKHSALCIGNYTTSSSIWNLFKVSKLHEPEGRMQFELSEKLTSANKFHIEREKSYIKFLFNNTHEKILKTTCRK